MNISYFAFRDVNQNGIYDMPDRPYAGLNVFLEHPDGSISIRKSNISGFANFAMSLNNAAHEISAPGRYRATGKPAEGWRVTSGNASQELKIKMLKASPGGLIAEKTLVPVGVAPELTIGGRFEVPTEGDPSGYVVSAISRNAKTIQAPLSTEGAYTIAVDNGVWQLEFLGPDGLLAKRVVKLSNYPVIVSKVVAGRQYASKESKARLVGFDDLTNSDTLYEIPNGYAGLHWHNWIAVHQKYYAGYGYINAAISGEYVAYNSSGHPAVLESPDPFDFLGAYVGVAWASAEKGFIDIKGWREDELIYRDRIKARTSGPLKLAADYKDVTRVEFSTEHYWQVVLDDIEISQPDSER